MCYPIHISCNRNSIYYRWEKLEILSRSQTSKNNQYQLVFKIKHINILIMNKRKVQIIFHAHGVKKSLNTIRLTCRRWKFLNPGNCQNEKCYILFFLMRKHHMVRLPLKSEGIKQDECHQYSNIKTPYMFFLSNLFSSVFKYIYFFNKTSIFEKKFYI